jgi:hypothetical protein
MHADCLSQLEPDKLRIGLIYLFEVSRFLLVIQVLAFGYRYLAFEWRERGQALVLYTSVFGLVGGDWCFPW